MSTASCNAIGAQSLGDSANRAMPMSFCYVNIASVLFNSTSWCLLSNTPTLPVAGQPYQ